MLVALDATGVEQWIGAGDHWLLLDDEQPQANIQETDGECQAHAPIGAAGEEDRNVEPDEDDEHESDYKVSKVPILEMWWWKPDGSLCGHVHGKKGFRDGELMTTSVVPPDGRFEGHVVRRLGAACATPVCGARLRRACAV